MDEDWTEFYDTKTNTWLWRNVGTGELGEPLSQAQIDEIPEAKRKAMEALGEAQGGGPAVPGGGLAEPPSAAEIRGLPPLS